MRCHPTNERTADWLHGFREVGAGSSGPERCHLCVVGLLE